MGFHSRILGEDQIRDELSSDCSNDCTESNESGVCEQLCVDVCPKICKQVVFSVSPPAAIHQNSRRISIISASVIASAVLVVCLLAFYFNSRRRRSRARSSGSVVVRTNEQAHNDHEFFDTDHHGIIIDHPIWHIRTIGLQPSVINSITVCRYRKGDGLVEGTDCSVCLSEFEEDETLRLLPKCNHAFHLPCIDTWLRSHTNCPLCRSPIVANMAAPPSASSSSGVNNYNNNNNNMQSPDEISVAIPEEDGEAETDDQEIEGQSCEEEVVSSNGGSEVQRVRRSVSMDSFSAIRISEAVTDVVKEKESNSRENGNGKHWKLVSSGSSSFLKRSVSCSAKFLLPRHS